MDASEFERERRRLTLLAYRMCASWADAEDVVQKVALEWLSAPDVVVNPAGWLTTATVRRAIDVLRVRRRDATYVGPWLPEPLVTADVLDPHDETERLQDLSTGFLLLAESLTPPQRAVVVLRALGYSHTDIAGVLAITPSASRQHHVRALRRLEHAHGRALRPVDGRQRRQAAELLRIFVSAAGDGDTVTLLRVLHAEVRAYQDGGGRTRAARRVLHGRSHVARFVVGVAGLHEARRAVRFLTVGGAPGAVVTLSDTAHVLSVQVEEGRIHRLFDVCNPDKHTTLRELSASRGADEGVV